MFLRRSSSATSTFFDKEYSKVQNPQYEVWQILTRNRDEIVIFEYDFHAEGDLSPEEYV